MPVLYFHMTTPCSFGPPRYLKFGGGGVCAHPSPVGKCAHPTHPTHPPPRTPPTPPTPPRALTHFLHPSCRCLWPGRRPSRPPGRPSSPAKQIFFCDAAPHHHGHAQARPPPLTRGLKWHDSIPSSPVVPAPPVLFCGRGRARARPPPLLMMMEEQHAPPDAHLGWPPAASRRGTAAAAQGPGLLAVPAWGGRAGRRWWRCGWWWSGACCLLLLCWPGRGLDQGPPVEARRGRLVQPHGPRAPRARRRGKWGGGGRRRSDVCPLSVLCCNSSLQTTVAAEDRESKRNDCQHAHAHPPTHPPLHPSRCLCRAGALASCYSNGSQRLRPSRGVRTPDGVQIWGAGPFFPHNAPISKESKGLRVKSHALHFLLRHHCPSLYLH